MKPTNSSNAHSPRIAIATGTRADWGLLLPLAEELARRDVDLQILATHAHFFDELGNTVEEIRRAGFNPIAIPTRRSPAQAVADATEGFANFFADQTPDLTVILGDRFEMLGAATAALLNKIPIAHIAGGNITRGAYDNTIRNALTQMASLHLPETDLCAARLKAMGANPENIVCAGSPGVYNALTVKRMSREELSESLEFDTGYDFFVATLHAATLDTATPEERMQDFISALRTHLDGNPGRRLIITYPNSDTDPTPLIAMIEDFATQYPSRVKSVPSLGRVRYLSACALSRGVIGNSSSGIEEIPSLLVPTLDIGIRQDGRERGPSVIHCGPSAAEIAKGLDKLISSEIAAIAKKGENPYYKPDTPRVQADAILNHISSHKKELLS